MAATRHRENVYAYELASVVIWIGYIQWLHDHVRGYEEPVLQPLKQILHMDAIIKYDDEGKPVEPAWPDADVIVGNPPFLGGKRLRTELHNKYVDDLFLVYDDRVPREADLVTYWFEKARSMVAVGRTKQWVYLPHSRSAWARIAAFWSELRHRATSSLRTLIVPGFSMALPFVWRWLDSTAAPIRRELNGAQVSVINSNLTTALDLTRCAVLPENAHLSFMGDTKGGDFDISGDVAATMIAAPVNPNGRGNSDVVVRWANGHDVTQRPSNKWIIDYGVDMSEQDAALYELPFEHVSRMVKPVRLTNNRATYRERWWIHCEARPGLRRALKSVSRYIATSAVAKHRLFAWFDVSVLPNHRLMVFARDDDYFFGVLQSHVHELWALATSSRHGVGNDPTYNNTTCFETFPMPWPPCQEPIGSPHVDAIAFAARDLVTKRYAWLNPPDASDAVLKKRTLTDIYNQRPAWLAMAHERLDNAVLDAYGWSHTLTDEEVLERLLALNHERVR